MNDANDLDMQVWQQDNWNWTKVLHDMCFKVQTLILLKVVDLLQNILEFRIAIGTTILLPNNG